MRPSVEQYAKDMDALLDEYAGQPGKTGWLAGDANSSHDLAERANLHMRKLCDLLMFHYHDDWEAEQMDMSPELQDAVRLQACHVGNYMMMINDRLGECWGDHGF